ncbi:DUF2141 domain-containing protein [Novosphingobium sp. 1949]|uniref:DUF2141 domain-containing protein n=1 Tax=Novosphingobium organovorum TaxID=2930092 RepID=A0ABT0BF30_9SPHN|nr:DUF2141 domain-containing protein [Novosphingobium organovorum]MCJ2183641.1 DUF2141 domain-containing protein [Novosphingobium organovorum]
MRHRSRGFGALKTRLACAVLALVPAPVLGAVPGTAPLAVPGRSHVLVTLTDLRSAKGQVLACLTRSPAHFPDCDKDPAARRLIVPVAPDSRGSLTLDFGAVPYGRYALAVIHDENANGKLDKALMIPREGFGFSRDAPVRMGPPSFAKAAFEAQGAQIALTVRMRYLL